MPQEQSATRERQRIDLSEPRRYKVTIYNDHDDVLGEMTLFGRPSVM